MLKGKLFKNGQSQALRLPKECRFDGKEVHIHKVGNALILLPEKNPWQNLILSLGKFSTDFMQNRKQPKSQGRDDF